jgi:hypothetical protein
MGAGERERRRRRRRRRRRPQSRTGFPAQSSGLCWYSQDPETERE